MNIYGVIFELVRHGAKLTGSREFGTETAASDWDFFTDSAEGLTVVGFCACKPTIGIYTDTNTAEVWVHKLYPIHVQVSRDMVLKAEAQDFLKSIPRCMLRNCSKVEMRKVWDWAFEQVTRSY